MKGLSPSWAIYSSSLIEVYHFAPWVYLMGSIVIALVSLSVHWSVFRAVFERDSSLDFSENLHEVGGQ